MIDIHRVAALIDWPVEKWAGQCHGISKVLVDLLRSAPAQIGMPADLKIEYRLVRGHWIGQAEEGSHFGYARGLPFVAHSWIQTRGWVMVPPSSSTIPLMGEIDPNVILTTERAWVDPIIDPTRFAFDGKEPYIYVGPNDCYDAGGNVWREMYEPTLLPFDPTAKTFMLSVPPMTEAWIWMQLQKREAGRTYPIGAYTYALVMWLANLSLGYLGSHAEPIFLAICKAGHETAIPIDNLNLVMDR